jgi:WD40 repeat protein
LNKNFLIFGYQGYIQSNLFGENKIYNIYKDSDDINEIHRKIIINIKDDEIQLIDLSFMDDDDNIKTIRIWNFHTKKLINKIKLKEKIFINSLCISNNKEYLIFWSNQNEIKSINIENGKIDIISKGGAYKQLALYSWTYPAFDYVILLSVPKSEKLLCPYKFNRAATF